MLKNMTFLTWVREREALRQRKEAGLPKEQWTVDPILRDYRFCNVSREDDKVTKWIKHNLRDPFDGKGSERDFLLVIGLARFLNETSALQSLLDAGVLAPGEPVNLREVSRVLHEHKARGGRTFGAAYMVACHDNPRSAGFGEKKIAYVCGVLNACSVPNGRSRESYVMQLSAQYGIGEFMAGQIAADMAYTSVLRDAPDHLSWAPLGNGAVRGVNRALGRSVASRLTRDEYMRAARAQWAALEREMPHIIEGRKLTMHDVASNVNCETDKYLRGGGKQRYK